MLSYFFQTHKAESNVLGNSQDSCGPHSFMKPITSWVVPTTWCPTWNSWNNQWSLTLQGLVYLEWDVNHWWAPHHVWNMHKRKAATVVKMTVVCGRWTVAEWHHQGSSCDLLLNVLLLRSNGCLLLPGSSHWHPHSNPNSLSCMYFVYPFRERFL